MTTETGAAVGPDTARVEGPAADDPGRPGPARQTLAAGQSSLPAALHAALPVALELGGGHAEAVRSWLEGVLGWQVVDGVDDDPVPPVLLLSDHRAPPGGGSDAVGGTTAGGIDLPTVLLLSDGSDPVRAAEAAVHVAPAAVLGWPRDRDRLAEVAAELLSAPRQRATSGSRLMVGGGAGGVGTTTVALALAGLRAWAGARTVVGVRGLGLPWRGVPTAALGSSDIWAVADRAAGLESLRIVTLLDHDRAPQVADPTIEAVVLDAGPDPDADVLVCRPDAAGLAAVQATTAAAVVVVGDGPAPHRALAAAAGGRRLLRLPWSARVARAGATGRLPAGLPGSWVRRLQPLVSQTRTGTAGSTRP